MAFDSARQQVVLFGGNGTGGFGGTLGDTWTWDGSTWTEQHPASSPPARSFMGMAYDAARKQVVLFGGSPYEGTDGTQFGDTWTWDGTNWMERHPATSPPPRWGPGMAYDAARQEIVLFGGCCATGYYGDTWAWDGTTWTQRAPSQSPRPRARTGMAFDAARGQVVMYGGYGGGVPKLKDTWIWDGAEWSQRFPMPSPGGRENFTLAYDAIRGKVVLFGGATAYDPFDRADTWTWDGVAWTNALPATSPQKRHAYGMAFDAARGNILLFGGCAYSGTCPKGDAWIWDGTTWTERVFGTVPPARFDFGMAYDAARRQVVMYGGCCLFGDTWTWDGTAWTEQHPPTAPDLEDIAGMTYDTSRRSAILVIDNFQPSHRTWAWNGTTWFRGNPPTVPDSRFSSQLAYDAGHQQTLLFGGEAYDDGCECDVSIGDTWTFDPSGTWTEHFPATLPTERADMGLAYDAIRSEVVMFGGHCFPGCPTSVLGDTWTWNGTNWTQEHPGTSPPAQYGLSMAYDATRGEVVLFGVDGTTWTWDGTNWTERLPATSPPARTDAGMTFDGARKRIVLFGGLGPGELNDTWIWDGTNWERVA